MFNNIGRNLEIVFGKEDIDHGTVNERKVLQKDVHQDAAKVVRQKGMLAS